MNEKKRLFSTTVYISDGRLPIPVQVTELRADPAERYDIIFQPTSRGQHIIETDIIYWVSGNVPGTTRTTINVI